MMKIRALNEPHRDDESEEETVAQESQETIAEAEYMRALKYQANGHKTEALNLYTELLETVVLCQIPNDISGRKLWQIRYNCHKNIAFLNEDRKENDLAIKHYQLAINIDSTDVYTLQRCGQLALEMNMLDLADFAFDLCLKRNPKHWIADNGMLKVLCKRHNILGAFGLALKLYQRSANHDLAVQVLYEITERFNHMIPFYEQLYEPLPPAIKNARRKISIKKSVFPEPLAVEMIKEPYIPTPPNLDKFRLDTINWYTIGKFIVDVYKHLNDKKLSMLFCLNFDDILINKNTIIETECNEVAATIGEKTLQVDANISNDQTAIYNELVTEDSINTEESPAVTVTTVAADDDDSDSNAKSDGNDSNATKSKSKRRCSDLHMLEQWGWHKTRRRKKPQQDRIEVDNSLNALLRKLYAKYFDKTFDDKWPFELPKLADVIPSRPTTNTAVEIACEQCRLPMTMQDFNEFTQIYFKIFVEKIKHKKFDIMALLYKWLKYISIYWNKHFPTELKQIYLDIFEIYRKHFEFHFWGKLNNNNISASFRICLLYLELEYGKKVAENSDLNMDWKSILDNIVNYFGMAFVTLEKDELDDLYIRLQYSQYLFCVAADNDEKCVELLTDMSTFLNTKCDEDYIMHMPNRCENCLNRNVMEKIYQDFERQASLKRIEEYYNKENWAKLFEIISKNLRDTNVIPTCDKWVNNFKLQSQIVLQSLWKLGGDLSCLVWAEKFLHYAISQYLGESKNTLRQKSFAESTDFILSYIETVLLNSGFTALSVLEDYLQRLTQNLIRLLSYQYDECNEKTINYMQEMTAYRPWMILHQIQLLEESKSPVIIKTRTNDADECEEDIIPHTFFILFTGHEFIGKRQLCTRRNGKYLHYVLDNVIPNFKLPIYDNCRDLIIESIEQVTYCLYGYPQKKGRLRHLEDHVAHPIDLDWPKAMQLFDIYRPEALPEFNSYKLESITTDMEQLLLKIIALMPKSFDIESGSGRIQAFMNGANEIDEEEDDKYRLPYKVNTLFYLLGDFAFKNRDFSKAIKYYMYDLSGNSYRFDSWAGVALSKASKIETKLNSLLILDVSSILTEVEEIIRCFERCISINQKHTLLWIEYGAFAYIIHAFCSRHLKLSSQQLSIEQFSAIETKKERLLELSFNCFTLAASLLNGNNANKDDESHEEKWLCQYMLGKIAEKRRQQPNIYLNYYLQAANDLYENSATYPIKINHNNPTTLSVEALEIFYRTNSAIIKFLEHNEIVTRETGDLMKNVLSNLSQSPFAFNKAKIDGNSLNALKRKIADRIEQQKIAIKETDDGKIKMILTSNIEKQASIEANILQTVDGNVKVVEKKDEIITNTESLSRRESQESGTGTTTTRTSSTTTSSNSSSISSSSDSDTDTDDSVTENGTKKTEKTKILKASEIEHIYKNVVRNLEECITRFPEHYKSIFRLVYHYMNGPSNIRDLKKCEQLLLGQYTTNLGNQINGLFSDKKGNNLFNGIWRIPSSEIDRPGSFSAHLVKCVNILIQTLYKTQQYKVLVDVSMQLYKTPDLDKRYITDEERLELYQQCLTYATQIMRNLLEKLTLKRDDNEILDFLIDIYKIHKKYLKYVYQKEQLFGSILIDVYKLFILDKVENLSQNFNYLDLAIKLCLQEIGYRKQLEKPAFANTSLNTSANISDAILGIANTPPPRVVPIPGLTLRNRSSRSSITKLPLQTLSINTAAPIVAATQSATAVNLPFPPMQSSIYPTVSAPLLTSAAPTDNAISMQSAPYMNPQNIIALMASMGKPINTQIDQADFNKFFAEYYKLLEKGNMEHLATIGNQTNTTTATNTQKNHLTLASSLPIETTITPSYAQKKDKLQPDIQVAPSNEITITAAKPIINDQPTAAIIPINASKTNVISNSGLFSTPVDTMATVSMNTFTTSIADTVSITAVPQNKADTINVKPPKINRSKSNTTKPYNRVQQTINPQNPALNTQSVDLTAIAASKAQFLASYTELLKQSNSKTVVNKKKNATDQSSTSMGMSSGGYMYPVYDKTVAAAMQRNASPQSLNYNQQSMLITSPNAVNPSAASSLQISPAKTLQQKLAERQKANLMNETTTKPKSDSCVDVIILD